MVGIVAYFIQLLSCRVRPHRNNELYERKTNIVTYASIYDSVRGEQTVQ